VKKCTKINGIYVKFTRKSLTNLPYDDNINSIDLRRSLVFYWSLLILNLLRSDDSHDRNCYKNAIAGVGQQP